MAFEILTIGLAGTQVQVAPDRGGLITSLEVNGKKLLYLDRGSFEDVSRSVRGGIPILFPFAGGLPDGKLLSTGTVMRQHGFAREMVWTVVEAGPTQVRMALESSEEIETLYPFEFRLEQTCIALENGVQVEMLMENRDDIPLPTALGWHPYFTCPRAQKPQLTTNLTNVDVREFSDDKEFNFGVVPPTSGRAEFRMPGLGRLRLSFSPEMRHLQFWSQPGKDFVCIEPFFGPPNVINSSHRLEIPPRSARTLFMRIELL